MDNQDNTNTFLSRRSLLTGAATVLVGGTMGFFGTSASKANSTPTDCNPPPLPWPWVKLDPLEAGRRAYRSYLTEKG